MYKHIFIPVYVRQTPQCLVVFDRFKCCLGLRIHVGQAGHTTSPTPSLPRPPAIQQ
jgi:hypothetical protein